MADTPYKGSSGAFLCRSLRRDPPQKASSLANIATEAACRQRGEARQRAAEGYSDLSALAVAELANSAKRNDAQGCAHWGAQCAKSGMLDHRTANHCTGDGALLLSAPPLWLAVYREDHVLVLALLRAGADPDGSSDACAGGSCACTVGGLSALHIAVLRGAAGCAQCLLSLRASADLRMCFGVLEDDEPEWEESSQAFVGGLGGLSALQLAAQRSKSTSDALAQICRALITHGASTTSLRAAPTCSPTHSSSPAAPSPSSPSMAPLLRALTTSDGEPIDCPICLAEVLALNAVFTPCCAHPFHAHCLKSQVKCPMCRTPMPEEDRARIGHAAHASAGGGHAAADGQPAGVSRLDVFMQQTNAERREAALALAFQSAAFSDEMARPGVDCGGGSNYGWRNSPMGAW